MTTYHDAVNDALERLDDLGYERSLGGGDLANHGPMAAETLALLGHGDRIPTWVETYRSAAPHHEPPVPSRRLDSHPDHWRPALGDISRAGDFEELFAREIAEDGWRTVLVRWWPRLLAGPMTGLTHGLIRTAHAVRSIAATPAPTRVQLTELCRGLGYWAARFIDSPGPGRLTGTASLPEAVARLRRLDAAPDSPADGMRYLREPAAMPGYHDNLALLGPEAIGALLSDMTAEFAGLCVTHDHGRFPVPLVHGVTAPAAARLVLPYLPVEQHEATVAAVWQAQVTLAMLATTDNRGESTARHRAASAEVPAWDALVTGAVEHGDEHVIKFTEACLREHTLRPDPRYAWAAAAAERGIESPHRSGPSAVAVRFGGS